MTLRSVILGALGVVVVCGITFFNDRVLRGTQFIGNSMPVSVYGMLIFFVFIVNRMLKKWALKGSEIAVILAMVLAVCVIPGSGLLRTFTDALILPHQYNRTEASWKEQKILDNVPDRMLVDISEDEDKVLGGFIQGLGNGSGHISPRVIPWRAWWKTLAFWVPLILSLFFAMMALSLVLHRQWSQHEHLPYPIAVFTNALLPESGSSASPVSRNWLFWGPLIAVTLIHLNNCGVAWFPSQMIKISLEFDCTPLSELFPTFMKGGGGFAFHPHVYFTFIAIAFFIPSDLSAAFGFGPYIWAYIAGVFAIYGLSLDAPIEGASSYTGMMPRVFVMFGACVGMFLVLLYTGRHFYRETLRGALSSSWDTEKTDRASVWGLRVFAVTSILVVIQIALAGVTWYLALAYVAGVIILHTIMARVIAESGLFHLQINAFPCTMLWGILGAAAMGPTSLLLLQIVTMVIIIDPREALMPFIVNANKLLELRGVDVGRVCLIAGAALILGLAVGIPVTLYIQHDEPDASRSDAWAYQYVPKMPFDNVVQVRQKLEAIDILDEAEKSSGWERVSAIRPNWFCLGALFAGIALVLAASAGRLRFTWWPIHPLMFVLFATWHAKRFAFSFLLGWLAKLVVMKYGGSALYNRLRPFVFGLIAGEIIGAVIPSVIGAIYYFSTGDRPPGFWVLSG